MGEIFVNEQRDCQWISMISQKIQVTRADIYITHKVGNSQITRGTSVSTFR